jgi:hypothetical protein
MLLQATAFSCDAHQYDGPSLRNERRRQGQEGEKVQSEKGAVKATHRHLLAPTIGASVTGAAVARRPWLCGER